MKMCFLFILILSTFTVTAGPGGGGSASSASSDAVPGTTKQIGNPMTVDKQSNTPGSRGGISGIIGNSLNGIRLGSYGLPGVDDGAPELILNDCDREALETCAVIQPSVPKDYLDFLLSYSSFKPLKSAPSHRIPGAALPSNCDCIKRKVQKDQSDVAFTEDKNKQRSELNEKILKAFGQKFVNDYSSNIEDVSFFLTQTSKMFSTEDKGKSLQCNDQAAYNNKINEVCKWKGISDQAFIQERKSKFINILSGQKVPFETRLGSMTNEILGARITSDLEGSNGAVFARQNYDEMRLTLATDDPKAKFINNFTSKILRNDFFITKMNVHLAEDFSPIEALMKVIQDYRGKPEFSQLGLSDAEINSFVKDNATTVNTFKFMMKVHPGFLHAMKDERVFENLLKEAKNSPNAKVIDLLATNSKILEPVLAENCNKMISDFANAVCVLDQDLVMNMDPNDLSRLIRSSNPPKTADQLYDISMDDLFVCEAKISSVNPDQKFRELANLFDTKLRSTSSDYFERELSRTKGNIAADAFSSTASYSATKGGLLEMSQLAERGRKLKSSVTSGGVASTEFYAQNVLAGRDMKIGKGSMNQEEAKKYMAESRNYENNKQQGQNSVAANQGGVNSESVKDNTQINNQNSQASSATNMMNRVTGPQYASNPTSNSSSGSSSFEAREALRKYIAEKNDAQKAEQAVAGLDDTSAVELNRLRAQNQSLLEASLKAETEKYEKMKSDLATLSKKAPEVARKIASVEDQFVASGFDSDETSSGRLPRSPDSRASAPGGGTGSSPQGQNASFGSVSNSSQVAKVSPISSNSSSTLVNEGQPRPENQALAETRSGLTITSTNVRDAVIPQQELNREIQNYIETANLQLSSIEEIKAKGIVFKYQVMENNKLVEKEVLVKYENLNLQARQAIDIKLARKNVSNQYSKLAVLRMLIGRSQQ